MKFTCTQDNLFRGLSSVVPIAGRNSQLPALQHVLIQVQDNVLHLTATDLEVGAHTIIGGKMDGEGSFTVPARSFLEYIGQLPSSDPVTLSAKKGGLIVTTKGFHAQFPVSSPDDFPLLPQGDSDKTVTLPAARLCDGLSRVVFAAAREETRPEIRSVYIQGEGDIVRLAATDSFRLSEVVIAHPGAGEFSFLLPLPAAQEVVRLFSGQEEVSIVPHDNYVVFKGDGIELSSRLVDGSYPDYQQIIPKSWKTKVHLPREEFVRALKTLAVFLPRDSRRVQLAVDPTKGELHAQVAGSESGQGDVRLSIEGEGEKIEMLVNIQYLLEGLQRINTDICEIECSGSQDPVVFRAAEPEKGAVYVVMPIQSG